MGGLVENFKLTRGGAAVRLIKWCGEDFIKMAGGGGDDGFR